MVPTAEWNRGRYGGHTFVISQGAAGITARRPENVSESLAVLDSMHGDCLTEESLLVLGR